MTAILVLTLLTLHATHHEKKALISCKLRHDKLSDNHDKKRMHHDKTQAGRLFRKMLSGTAAE
ncbi:hypothetical protein BC349_07220 [Flavihumibacter stibioxidans]|uniref:Uncharacterized protein n=1 Tax=Flavihumibacter stibioxidans TaxID=1834163 RepID=A0ABR7M701_9BACT|nr:hypothetical protein [Flavihumibacter stibioxidans]